MHTTRMGHPRAAERTRTGFSRVQKGRCYLKSPLGEYRTPSGTNPYHCYTSTDVHERLAFQPSILWDVQSLKRIGHVIPSLNELVTSDYFVTQKWASCEDSMPKKIKQSEQRGSSSKPPEQRLFEYRTPQPFNPSDGTTKWQKRLKEEFRQAISRMGCPMVFSEYINTAAVKKKTKTRKKPRILEILDNKGETDEELIDRVKKSGSAKIFTANKIPWKSYLQPQSLSKIATATSSFENSNDLDTGPHIAVSEDSDSSLSEDTT